MITLTAIAAKVREMVWSNPLLQKYGLGKYGNAPIPVTEVVSLCQQLEWTERELETVKRNLSQAHDKTRPRASGKRRYVKATPNVTVAAHRSVPAFSLSGLMVLWPALQWILDKPLTDTHMMMLIAAGGFAAGTYLIFLFFRSI